MERTIFYAIEAPTLCGLNFQLSDHGIDLLLTEKEAEQELADIQELDEDSEDFITTVYANERGEIETDAHEWLTLRAFLKLQGFSVVDYRSRVLALIQRKKDTIRKQ